MFTRSHTMMAIWLAAAVFVLPEELSARLSCKFEDREVTIFETDAGKGGDWLQMCRGPAPTRGGSITLEGRSRLPAFAEPSHCVPQRLVFSVQCVQSQGRPDRNTYRQDQSGGVKRDDVDSVWHPARPECR